jgi:CheY-like chemotaxis protein
MTQSRRMIPDEATRVPLMPKPAIILLVEDEFDVREIVRVFLAEQDYQIIEAGDGDAAMRILETNEPIDLLLTDIVMPGSLDGFALSAEARRLRPSLKVLHISGYSEQLRRPTGATAKDELLAKPIRRTELLERIGLLLGRWAVDRNPILRRAYEHWLEKAANGQTPDRRDLDPGEIVDILPYLSIIELIGPAQDREHRYRLVGTRVVEALGYNPTGRRVDDFANEGHADFMKRLLDDVEHSRQPLYAASSFRANETGLSTERILLPFRNGGRAVQQIIIVQTFDWTRRKMTIHELAQEHARRVDSIEHPPAGLGRDPAPPETPQN